MELVCLLLGLVLEPLPGKANGDEAPTQCAQVTDAVPLEGIPARVVGPGVELDDHPLGFEKRIDFEISEHHVDLRHRQSVAPAERQELVLERGAGRFVVGLGELAQPGRPRMAVAAAHELLQVPAAEQVAAQPFVDSAGQRPGRQRGAISSSVLAGLVMAMLWLYFRSRALNVEHRWKVNPGWLRRCGPVTSGLIGQPPGASSQRANAEPWDSRACSPQARTAAAVRSRWVVGGRPTA